MIQLPTFFLGTTNPYKIREIASILRPLEIELRVTDPIDPEETGETFHDNALIKAEAYSEHVRNSLLEKYLAEYEACGIARADSDIQDRYLNHLELSKIWTICEDSGIVIPALGGLPGPWAARFADCVVSGGKITGHNPSKRSRKVIDRANNELVLELMHEIEQPNRAAMFVVSFVIADIRGRPIFQTTSNITGWILSEMRGDQGFGYDPIFANDKSFGKSFAEIDGMRKNLFSHRRKALQAFTAWLATQIR